MTITLQLYIAYCMVYIRNTKTLKIKKVQSANKFNNWWLIALLGVTFTTQTHIRTHSSKRQSSRWLTLTLSLCIWLLSV